MLKGIDVSKWQGVIDWKKVKNAGIKFAILRDGYGRSANQVDSKFEVNYAGAKAAGIPVGAYHYSYATNAEAAKAEARYCLSIIKGKQFEYPIVYDVEDKTQASLSREKISAIIKAFCSVMEEAGYFVCIYANKSWLDNKIDNDCKKKYDVWLAQWVDKPTYSGSYGMWQYTSNGSVDGISGRVDMDISYKDYPSIIKEKGLNGFSASKTESATNTKTETKVPVETSKETVTASYKAGTKVTLNKDALYASATASKATSTKTGTFYIYDGEEINGRYRITNSAENVKKTPVANYVTGYVKKTDLYGNATTSKSFGAGTKVNLNNAELYASATAKSASGKKTGTFYLYDGKAVSGRYRITTSKDFVGKTPVANYVTGFVKKEELK